jgi:hypothetical protein
MGQYWKPVILEEDKKTVKYWFDAHEFGDGLKLMEHSYLDNYLVSSLESLIVDKPQIVVWAGDYEEQTDGLTIYERCDGLHKANIEFFSDDILITTESARFIINHSKKLFVDKTRNNTDKWVIHPLPLLTANSNGKGGGDYYGINKHLVGTWAKDLISVLNKLPIGYDELIPNFGEI